MYLFPLVKINRIFMMIYLKVCVFGFAKNKVWEDIH